MFIDPELLVVQDGILRKRHTGKIADVAVCPISVQKDDIMPFRDRAVMLLPYQALLVLPVLPSVPAAVSIRYLDLQISVTVNQFGPNGRNIVSLVTGFETGLPGILLSFPLHVFIPCLPLVGGHMPLWETARQS